EIAGKDHTGTKVEPVPAIFGMSFQTVNVEQKIAAGGYLDVGGTPSPDLQAALDHTDQSIGKMLAALGQYHLPENTVILLSAKHGQTPIDPNKRLIVNHSIIPSLVLGVQSGLLAQQIQDDVALLWLTDQSKVGAVVATLSANEASAHIQEILSGDQLKLFFN